jgi:peptidoglycan L-alanyl-D-glutamate endopeptidase CwlK
MYILGRRSLVNLGGVRNELVAVVKRAIQITDTTMNSRHLDGHAVDLGAWVDGTISWHWPHYHKIADAMNKAAAELGIELEWGGDWKSFPDGPHFQLPWPKKPAKKSKK